MRHSLILIGSALCVSVLLSASLPAPAQAVGVSSLANDCQTQIYDELSLAQTLFRARLLGVKDPKEEAKGSSRLGPDGKVWLKVGDGEDGSGAWRRDGSGDTRTNETMRTPILPEQQGIFERQQARTSDLVPELTQAYRTLACHTEAVCRNAQLTLDAAQTLRTNARGGTPYKDWIPVQTAGCEWINVRPFTACYALRSKATVSEQSLVQDTCGSASQKLLDREADMLKLLTAYDAAYRSFLQFSGVFDHFLTEFKGDLLTPIEQATSVVSQLSRIPCFISQCSE